ncbi:MAG: cupin [Pseudomonadota bacterium]|nr:cupin [Pseudomonadota bacterium]MEE3288084.1 cupin [Pseudomonadota bacterium]HCF72229.1 cupin [Gammaproteobacteria bacterium]
MGKKEGWTYVHSEAKDAVWEKGMRDILSYRYLGIDGGTKGDYVAQVIRNNGKQQTDSVQQWHVHDCTFQMTFVLNGWATFEWEGQGVRTIRKGDCINQIPMIKHREIEMSEDFEVLEIVAPADFKTHTVDGPD